MDKILNSIETRIKYIESNTENAFLLSMCNVIRLSIQEIKERKFTTQETVDQACDIAKNNISKMRRTPDQTNMVYRKMDELDNFIEKIKSEYFN